MNPNQNTVVSSENLLEKAFENQTLTSDSVVIEENSDDYVTYTDQHKADIKNSWADFYALRTEDLINTTAEKPVQKFEVKQTIVETTHTEVPKYEPKKDEIVFDKKPIYLIDEQKGSGSWLEDAGFQLNFKGLLNVIGFFGKNLFGAMNIFREIGRDTGKVLYTSFKKEKPVKKEDPSKAKKEAEKKKKFANIRAFYEALKAQSGSVASIEAVRVETQERENVNKTIKLTNASYKGIKDNFGRLTIYAANMFEREQLEQEKTYRKIEKQQKMAATKGPDLNLDKAAEGGFLSATGGQGAG